MQGLKAEDNRTFDLTSRINDIRRRIRVPAGTSDRSQDEEWFEFRTDGGTWKRLRIHDYDALYAVPGLYEALVYRLLKCCSPRKVVRQLVDVLEDWPLSPDRLRVLDLGAGNGIVAERLREIEAEHVVGVDILPEAAAAAKRDRPEAYDDYIICDLAAPSEFDRARLTRASFNCLTTVAALGFGDIPPAAFANAFNAISTPGWLAMCIKEDFLRQEDESGFAALIRRMIGDDTVRVESHRRYCHRRTVSGRKLFYVTLIARKMKDLAPSALRNGKDGARRNGRRDATIFFD